MSLLYVTTHFSWAEFDCHDGTPVPDSVKPHVRRLCNSLELIRARFGAPLIVNSGYRTHAYNKRIGGALRSQHVFGTAADFHPVERSKVATLAALIDEMLRNRELPDVGGFGIYRNWVHVDVRPRKPNGGIARWYGNGVGSEQ